MKVQSIFILMLTISLGACSFTSQSASRNSQLRIQNLQLQKELNEKEAELVVLKQEVSTLMSAVNDLEGQKYSAEAEDDNFVEYRPFQNETSSVSSGNAGGSSTASKADGEDIIRVNVDEKTVQTALKKAGYYQGRIDGKIGKQSKAAINNFQKDHALTVDGIVGGNTWSELKTYLD